MKLVLALGLAIALSATVLGAGVVWLRRQAKRVTAKRAAEHRRLFQLEPLPPAGDEVLILVEEEDGRTTEIESVHWPAIGWTDAVTLPPAEGDVLGWRRHPFRRKPRPVDYAGWTGEEIAAEIERRFGDGTSGEMHSISGGRRQAGDVDVVLDGVGRAPQRQAVRLGRLPQQILRLAPRSLARSTAVMKIAGSSQAAIRSASASARWSGEAPGA